MSKTYFCCEAMAKNVENGAIRYSDIFDEYGIPLPEDSVSVIRVSHCPWCGTTLPKSKRNEWFQKLERLGYDAHLFDENIPVDFKSSKWRE